MNDNIIYLMIIAIVYLMYKISCYNTIEKFAENSPNISEQIKEQIGKIYKADVQAIRNLSDISKKLQEGSLTIPGNLTIEGDINMKDGKSIKSTGVLKIVPKKGTLFAKDNGSTGNIDIKGSIVCTTIDGINNNINKTNNELNNKIIDIKKTQCGTNRLLYAVSRSGISRFSGAYAHGESREDYCKLKLDREKK